ncbi:MAG TPA: hypothetical protein VI358_01525 [Pseudolabrys sp.]
MIDTASTYGNAEILLGAEGGNFVETTSFEKYLKLTHEQIQKTGKFFNQRHQREASR